MVSISTKMEDEINSVIKDIQNTKSPKLKEAENFRNETLKYLEFRKQLFASYKNYGLQTTPQGREWQRMNLVAIQRQENIINHNLQAAQMNFARANHVKVR